MLDAGFFVDRLVGRDAGRDQHHTIERELKVCLLSAYEVSKMWRIEGSAKDPDPHDVRRQAGSRPDVTGALHEVLVGAQLADPDRPAGVEFLGGVADLRPHPELAAIGEPGRR